MSMAKKDAFNVEFIGVDKYIKDLKKMERNVDRVLIEEYTKYGMLVEEGTKALVHHDEGTLEDSINFGKAENEGNLVAVEGGSNIEYALRRHEEPGRGPGTLGKQMWRGYQPGPKYLENAIKATEKDYDKTNEKAIDRILRSKS